MARIDVALLQKLQQRLRLSKSHVYRLIDQKVRELSVPREIAAIALAADSGVNISRFSTHDQLAQIRQARAGGAVTVAPTAVAPSLPPTRRRTTKAKPATARQPRTPADSVFVVHGRNVRARDELFKFLRALGLKPIEWNKAIRMTGEASPYIGTILDTAFREAAAIVVLFTPDDEARLLTRLRRKTEPRHETTLTPQPRANVIFEAGMAFGRNPNKTVLVELGDLRPFSDIAGRHTVRLNNSGARRRELSTKLRNAGCAVDEDGTDWLEVGDLDV